MLHTSHDTGKEGSMAKMIETKTSKIPSDAFLWAALGAIGTAICCKMMKREHSALFVGQWVAPFLLLGVYNKLVKQQGHDKEDQY